MILFDLGGVLVDASFDDLASLLSLPPDRESIRAAWLSSSAVRDFEVGAIDSAEFASRFVQEWSVDLAPERFAEAFAAWPRGPYGGAAALVARVREDHRVGCFSNCNVLHWERFGPFLSWFDVAISSHEIGHAKPDAAAFAAALRISGSSPEETWFFDDSPSNIEAAKALGMRAVRVRGIEELEAALIREGLIEPAWGERVRPDRRS